MVSVMRRVPNPVRIHCGLVSILGLVVVSAVLGCGSPGTICSTCSSTSDGGARRDGGSVVGSSCRPPSTTWKLVNGGVAGSAQAPLSCQKPIKTSTLPSGQVRALGVHQVGEVVSFDVPAGTGTISIVSQASSGVGETITVKGSTLDNAVVPLTLADPSGDILYDDNAKPPTDGSTAKVYFLEGPAMTGVMTLPNTTKALTTSASGYPAGNWSLTVNDWAAECAATPSLCTAGASGTGTYDVTVLLKPITGSTGTVDLAFYFVTASLTAAQALTDSHVQRYLSTLAVLYGRAGLCLGTITFYDVPSWAKNKWATGVDATKLTMMRCRRTGRATAVMSSFATWVWPAMKARTGSIRCSRFRRRAMRSTSSWSTPSPKARGRRVGGRWWASTVPFPAHRPSEARCTAGRW